VRPCRNILCRHRSRYRPVCGACLLSQGLQVASRHRLRHQSTRKGAGSKSRTSQAWVSYCIGRALTFGLLPGCLLKILRSEVDCCFIKLIPGFCFRRKTVCTRYPYWTSSVPGGHDSHLRRMRNRCLSVRRLFVSHFDTVCRIMWVLL
jgi:hypothetical protein